MAGRAKPALPVCRAPGCTSCTVRPEVTFSCEVSSHLRSHGKGPTAGHLTAGPSWKPEDLVASSELLPLGVPVSSCRVAWGGPCGGKTMAGLASWFSGNRSLTSRLHP